VGAQGKLRPRPAKLTLARQPSDNWGVSSFAKLIGVLAAASACIAVAGILLSQAWYHDDACTFEQWKCDLGNIGFTVAIYLGVAAVILLVVFVAATALSIARRR
jgi:hypothetical protein